jgi:hypothetical protein
MAEVDDLADDLLDLFSGIGRVRSAVMLSEFASAWKSVMSAMS